MRFQVKGRLLVPAALLILAVCGEAGAEGFRNIASITANLYDADGGVEWRLETTDVFLARIVPSLTAVVKVTRVDSDGWNQHLFYLGPVVNFTDTLYLETAYGLGIDSDGSDGRFSHEIDVNFNYETDTTATSLGLKADWFPETDYFYFLPSISGKFHPLPAMGLFGKFFLSVDSFGKPTVSFWGQADYRFSPLLGARAGFTAGLNNANNFGGSLLAGADFFFRSGWSLKYSFQYLSDTVEYQAGVLKPRSGISNALILDVRF
jgi:hypothetical protein